MHQIHYLYIICTCSQLIFLVPMLVNYYCIYIARNEPSVICFPFSTYYHLYHASASASSNAYACSSSSTVSPTSQPRRRRGVVPPTAQPASAGKNTRAPLMFFCPVNSRPFFFMFCVQIRFIQHDSDRFYISQCFVSLYGDVLFSAFPLVLYYCFSLGFLNNFHCDDASLQLSCPSTTIKCLYVKPICRPPINLRPIAVRYRLSYFL